LESQPDLLEYVDLQVLGLVDDQHDVAAPSMRSRSTRVDLRHQIHLTAGKFVSPVPSGGL